MSRWKRCGRLAAVAVIAAAVCAPVADAATKRYQADISRTTGGIPHIKAKNFGSLGFGYGYAYAEDQLCTLADLVVTTRAKRSLTFGPDAKYNPDEAPSNLESDFFWQDIADRRVVQKLVARTYPHGPSREVRQMIKGFVAGYNAYLRKKGRSGLTDPRCKGKSWVTPITELDMYKRFYQLGVRASAGNFVREIVAAQPPAAGARAASAAKAPDAEALRERLAGDPVLGEHGKLGSNAYAFGGDATTNGKGLLLGNPHFPWHFGDRWYELHLTIPGKLDVTGAALQAAPVVNIGFNKDVAWSHTVSTARRFTPYELKLVPGKPTTYRYDGKRLKMRARTVKVRVQGGGVRTHTFYDSRWGRVFHYPGALMGWSNETAYALADANDSFRLVNQWAAYDKATSVDGLRRASAKIQGNPWTNTIAADRHGNAYYGDDSVVPNVEAGLQKRCAVANSGLLLSVGGVVLLDGSRPSCRWGNDKDAAAKGILGAKRLPRLKRRDYVANANDSYWLANPKQLLAGFANIIGPEATQRSLRTRLTFLQVEEALAAGKMDMARLQALMFSNRNLSAELARDAVVAACRDWADLAEACSVLAAWDLRANADSRGAVLWREFWERATQGGTPWNVAFNASQVLTTPNTLNTADAKVRTALTAAVADLRAKGIALNVALGDLQAEPRGDKRIPIHGCTGGEGCFNVISTHRDDAGRYNPYTGSSFVMTVAFGAKGPQGEAILSYSQSENPTSPHYSDQTELFAQKKWLPMRFTPAEIKADPNLRRYRVAGRG